MKLFAFLAAFAALSSVETAAAPADDLKATLDKIILLDRDGKHDAALDELNAASVEYAQRAPLHLRKFIEQAFPAKGLGAYVERTNSIYSSGERVNFYLEPSGIKWSDAQKGFFKMNLTFDIAVKSDDGNFAVQQNNLPIPAVPTRNPLTGIFLNIFVNTNNYLPGGYKVLVTVHDLNRNQSVTGTGHIAIQ